MTSTNSKKSRSNNALCSVGRRRRKSKQVPPIQLTDVRYRFKSFCAEVDRMTREVEELTEQLSKVTSVLDRLPQMFVNRLGSKDSSKFWRYMDGKR